MLIKYLTDLVTVAFPKAWIIAEVIVALIQAGVFFIQRISPQLLEPSVASDYLMLAPLGIFLLIAGCRLVYAPYKIYLKQQKAIMTCEDDSKPQLEFIFKAGDEPYEHTEPAGIAGPAQGLFRVGVRNKGKRRLESCEVKLLRMTKILNINLPIHLKQRHDNPAPPHLDATGHIAHSVYKTTFPLSGGGEEHIDVAELNERAGGSEINLCYAESSSKAVRKIPRDEYVLTLLASADLGDPCEQDFILSVENGLLRLRMK